MHIPAHGIGAVGAGDGDGVGQAGAALGDAGIGVGVAEMKGAGRMGNCPPAAQKRRRGLLWLVGRKNSLLHPTQNFIPALPPKDFSINAGFAIDGT